MNDDLRDVVTPEDRLELEVKGLAADCIELGNAALDAAEKLSNLSVEFARLGRPELQQRALAYADAVVSRVEATLPDE